MTQGNLRCRVIVAALAVAAAITGLTADTAAARHKKRRLGPAAKIQVLSNRADLISGGDALVAIRLPARTSARRLRITANGRNVGSAFAPRPDGRYEGLLTGLANGPNRIAASLPRHKTGRTTIVNHPIGGPVFSG